MRKIRLSELNKAVRAFLTDALGGDVVIIEDEEGQPQGSFLPYRSATPERQQRAEKSLARLWKKTDKGMREAGVTEEDVDRILQEDD